MSTAAPIALRHEARLRTRSARATRALGARLGRLLRPGDVVALLGELGAGKTELVRGVCSGARVPAAQVSSPTFAIVATYRGRLPVFHADLYRVADEDELFATGFGDLVGGEGALLVEWADRVPEALPADRLALRLEHDARASSVRHVELVGTGVRHAALAAALARPPRRREVAPKAGRAALGAKRGPAMRLPRRAGPARRTR